MRNNDVLSVRIDYGTFTPITIVFLDKTDGELDMMSWIDTQTSYESFDLFLADLAEELLWQPLTESSIQYTIGRVSGLFPSGYEFIYDIDDFIKTKTLEYSPDGVTLTVEIV